MKFSTYQNPWIQMFLVLLAVVIGYLYYSQTMAPGYPTTPPRGSTDASYLQFKDLKLDFAALNADLFGKLKTYGDYPIQPGGAGREDIFGAF